LGALYGPGYNYDFGYSCPYGYGTYYYTTPYYYSLLYGPYALPYPGYGFPPYMPMAPGWGAANVPQAAPVNQAAANPAPAVPPMRRDADEPEPKRENTRSTNTRATTTAWKYIGYGDALFAKQRYAEAEDRYRRASSTAPQLTESWFRRALALTATGRYDLAVAQVKRGLKLNANWPKIVFDAADTLWPDAKAKEAYFATLTKLAAQNPANADLLFLVGLHFHIDGQHDQAQKYLARAQRIAGHDADHIDAFLDAAK
jgi:hypothetical protein